MGEVEKVNYISVGKTVGIYVYVNGEKQLFTLESELREQIAQEIEAKCDLDNIENCLLINHDLCDFHVSANIARGK